MTLKFFNNLRVLRMAGLLAGDAVFLCLSFIMAGYVSGHDFYHMEGVWPLVFAVVIVSQIAVFVKFGLYRAILRYASVDSIITILKAVSVSTAALILGLYLINTQVPVRVLMLDWLFTVFFIGGSRFVVRYYFELKQRLRNGRRVLIYGAGDMGSLALRQLLLNKAILYSPVGFIDDDAKKVGSVIRGVKVLGTVDNLEGILSKYNVEDAVVAIAEIDGDNLRAVVKRCKEKGVVCRIIPCFSRLMEIEPDIRNVELADLMRRTPRDLDKKAVGDFLRGKRILVTGAAGSIGSEIVRQCLPYGPSEVLALDQSEFGLYSLEQELSSYSCVKYLLCDAANRQNLEGALSKNVPEIIFHAAAYKHVPLLEENPAEAVRNNVLCTKNLCELADRLKVKSFVMISTDKAVRPSSIMGATKRLCEIIVQNFDKRSATEFVSVRFGNVLGSSGSVVPKFVEQIRRGGPVTVTHPDATRYFMLIDEAVQLVLQAASIGKGGEIFILDMGKPIRIADMAEDLIYLMGRQPYKDVDISFTGMRPGEKIHEELFNDEVEQPTKFKEITVGRASLVDWDGLSVGVNELILLANDGRRAELLEALRRLIPDGSFSV